ncbi:MAG: energy-coupled thiamine transporter ThiT [Clostridia bacterium]|nr:energy-coupled thiamine transporter ThiT [Clostridia bacterium]
MSLSLMSAKWYPILFDSPMNAARSVAIWLTVALVAAFLVCVFVLKGERRKKFLKISLIFAIAYACVIGIMFLTFTFVEDGIKTILFVPLLLLVLAIAGSAIVLVFKRNKALYIILGCIVGAALIAVFVCMGVYYGSGEAEESNWVKITLSENVALYLCAAGLIGVIVFFALFFGRKDKKGFDSKSITYAAICIAMSFALSYLRIVKLPQGGSITAASLLPLMIYSYMFGTKKGVFAGMIYGILQAVQDPFIVHPAQFLLDYPIAFAAIGVAGMFAKVKKLERFPQIQIALGGIVASILRFIAHVLSGVFAFSEYSTLDNVWVYSMGYNSFVFIDIAIVIVAAILVFSSRAFVRQVRKFNTPVLTKTSAPQTEVLEEAAPAADPQTESKPSPAEINETDDDKK